MKKDEKKVSKSFNKIMKLINIVEMDNQTVYEFEDSKGNYGVHYQIHPEYIKDKTAKRMASQFLTKMKGAKPGYEYLCICKCRMVQEEGYDNAVAYMNVDRVCWRAH